MTIFISHDNCYTVKRFLKMWGPELRGNVRFIYYDDLAHRRTLPREAALFTDLERLSPPLLALAIEAAHRLKNAGVTVVNDPSRVLRRYDLLCALQQSGNNRFSAYRLGDDREAMKFPVFLRLEREHQGNLSPLLENAVELESAIAQATGSGIAPDNLLIVEFCDTGSSDGLYRKYSFFVAGGQFVPRHILFNEHWMSKNPDVVTEALCDEEMRYLQAKPHPHEAFFRDVFNRAGIEYGRADYGLLDGAIQVWEINTNPTLVPQNDPPPEREPNWNYARERICVAMKMLIEADSPAGSTPGRGSAAVPFKISKTTRKALRVRPSDWWRHPLHRAARPLSSYRAQRFLRNLRLVK